MSPEDRLAAIGALRTTFEPRGNGLSNGALRDWSKTLDTIRASDFAGLTLPRRQFLVEDLVPLRNVTMLSGHGGVGKSLLALQLAIAVPSGTDWIGFPVRKAPVLYLSAEEDEAETHIRLAEICDAESIALSSLTDLHIKVLAGQDAVLAAEDLKSTRMVETRLYERLVASMATIKPDLLVIDNLADVFSGNENVRGLARQFVGMLRRLALEHESAVLLLAHPSLSGINSGSGASGNTAWHNSVRSRLYLKPQNDDPKLITDEYVRRLATVKANYAKGGGDIGLRWDQGRFIRTDQVDSGTRAAMASRAERVCLHLIDLFNRQGRTISTARGPNYAPVVFASHPQSEGVTKVQFEAAMNNLLDTGKVAVVESGPPSRRRQNIVVARQP
jgi:RecA-family ATPase